MKILFSATGSGKQEDAARKEGAVVKEASFYEKGENGKVDCYLCRHHCLDQRRQTGHLRRPGEPGRHPLHPGVRETLLLARRPHRKEAPVPLFPRLKGLFHCHGRLQLPVPSLPESRDIPASERRGPDRRACDARRTRWSSRPARRVAAVYPTPTPSPPCSTSMPLT